MRVTADRDDPDFRAEFLGCKVFLDGVELRDCIEASEETGMVGTLSRDKDGNLIVKHGHIVYEARVGKVRIELPTGLFRPSWPA